ncbi:hypothetical protein HDU87_000296 [Geranomyces variabilis]|uniref:Uncharacterized protein n=1 Tax=Geranomyces variabilis TaxID=109894 RepID=A0AAD5TUA4_9FUNG|nr:hypothetical protein HDU87_000296 [Geranomyces variabilis]
MVRYIDYIEKKLKTSKLHPVAFAHAFKVPTQAVAQAAYVASLRKIKKTRARSRTRRGSLMDTLIEANLSFDFETEARWLAYWTDLDAELHLKRQTQQRHVAIGEKLAAKDNTFCHLRDETVEKYGEYPSKLADPLVEDDTHNWLVCLFGVDRHLEDWQRTLDGLDLSDTSPQVTSVGRVRFLWEIAEVHYTFGEITDSFTVSKTKADGIGHLSNADKFPIVYVEGSRPVVPKKGKEPDDAGKIAVNMIRIQEMVLEHILKHRRRAPESLAGFGGQSFKTEISAGYVGIESTSVPRDMSEILFFVQFYESILK